MSDSPSMVNTIYGAVSFISERGILSGIYIGSMLFGLILGSHSSLPAETYVWIAGICVIIGIILSNITYELLLFAYRWISHPIVLRSFYRTIGADFRMSFPTYTSFRIFRDEILESRTPSHFKSAIEKDIKLRLTLTYISSSSFFVLLMLFIAIEYFSVEGDVVRIELLVVLYILVSSLLGNVGRSSSIGRTSGYAYLQQINRQSTAQGYSGTDNLAGNKPILCLDFDGVLHWYRNGWKDASIIDDVPVPGAQNFMRNALNYFQIVIFSARSKYPSGISAMKHWMKLHGFPEEIDFVTDIPRALVFIDDQSITFDGNWPDPATLLHFRPWYTQKN